MSASGLNIVEDNLNITKMYEQNYQGVITIENTENFTFQNLRIDEGFATITPLTLLAGENATVVITIDRDEDFTGTLTIKGDYEADLGQSNKTVQVGIDRDTGLSICSMDLIVGDKIQWNNYVLDEVVLKSTEDFATILEASNFTKTFNYVEEFDYYVKRNGAKFTETCRINVRDSIGWGHSIAYDDKINTNIVIEYEPTTIAVNFLETEYTIEYNKEVDDIFSIRNTGVKTAKNVRLSSDWIDFSDNNFDIAPGTSKNIEYTIKPSIFQTNQTNKTYSIEVEILGNFDYYVQDLNVTIPYASVDSKYSSSASDPEFFHNLYYFFCDLFPEDEVCIRTTSSGGTTTTIEYTQETISGLIDRQTKMEDEDRLFKKTITENENRSLEIEANKTLELSIIKEELGDSNDRIDGLMTAIYFVLAFLLLVAFFFIRFILLKDNVIKSKVDRSAKFEEGEFGF